MSPSFLDEALCKACVSVKVRRIIHSIFSAASGCVRIRNPDGTTLLSDTFDISRGVLQGDIFSPVAFITGLMHTFQKYDSTSTGVTIGKPPHQVTIRALEYADDAGLLDTSTENASTRVTSIAQGSRHDAAMEISVPKTKVMHIHKQARVSDTTEEEIAALHFEHVCPDCSRDFPTKRGLSIHQGRWCDNGATIRSRKGSLADKTVKLAKRKKKEAELPHVTIEGQALENVYSFEYLGSRVQCDGDDMADVEYRINIAQSVFGSLSNIWTDHRLSSQMKIRLYQAAVCSTLTHACEAWTMTDEVSRKVNGFNSRCLHIITGDHYRDTALTPTFDLLSAIRKRRLRFLGHILRLDPDRLLKQTLFAYIHNVNSRPAGSLLHGCEHIPMDELVNMARDRSVWRQFVNS